MAFLAPAVLVLALGLTTPPAAAFEMLDVRYLRENGYRSCERCTLSGANFRHANLRGANFRHANLRGANLSGANLGRANLSGANLEGANLSGADLREANLEGARLVWANLSGAYLSSAKLQGANLYGASLAGAELIKANFAGASLRTAKLQGANLRGANLEGASLHANLSGANLSEANLEGARLDDANLSGADLRSAKLRSAILLATNLEGSKLSGASVFYATYEAAAAPARGHLAGLDGLTTVRFGVGQASGLAQLRAQLAGAGLLDLERQATYALERQITEHKLQSWGEQPLLSLWVGVEGAIRWIVFELPVGYGLYPGRALRALGASIGVFALIYLIPLTRSGSGGIHRVWPEGRLEARSSMAKLVGQAKVERLRPRGWWGSLLRALQFSILSAFHLGWRELNVGTWLARVQTREYTLRATGWVRAVAGVQSLLSVYLLAMWVLTYFGRPFG
jgi:uncharacterized protein YjbI with pentapeptide repeats